MSDYHLSPISKNNRREMQKLDALLNQEGIERDKNLEYTVGLYDEDYNLAATGSCFGNTLRCMAVDSAHQGEGLLNQIVSHLIEYEYENGILHLFLYTKCDKALFFKDLGFYEIMRVEGRVVFMENRKEGFSTYLKNLKKDSEEQLKAKGRTHRMDENDRKQYPEGAVIMNANPFTLGHLYLLEAAAAACEHLHVFVVSEDRSLVPFSTRFCLVKQGAAHISNLIFHETGSYMISSATFPSYFLKEEQLVIRSHAALDIALFTRIAKELNISVRFVGEEPFSQVTGIYNEVMQKELKASGIDCIVFPRKTTLGDSNSDNTVPVSASAVRRLIQKGELENIRTLVPESTYRYFTSPEAEKVILAIRESSDVIHY